MIYIPEIVGSSKSILASLGLIYDVYEKNLLSNNAKNIYLYGDFVFNKKVKEELSNLEINSIYDLTQLTDNDILILNAYGVPKDVYDYLHRYGIEYYDGTDKKILKLEKEIETKYKDEYEIVFVGNDNLFNIFDSYCNNDAIYINNKGEFVKLSNNIKKYVICSSSFDKNEFDEIIKVIENNYNCDVEKYILKDDMLSIINSSVKISKKSDLMIVVGDKSFERDRLVEALDNTITFNNISEFLDYALINDLGENIGITGDINVPIKEIYNYKYLLSFIKFYKKAFNELKYNQDKINNLLRHEVDNDLVKKVVEDFIDLNQDGDYIKGTLIALGEYLSSNKNNKFLNLAYAYEMFQTSVLIHDDIIDNARTRRGKMTIPRRFCKKYLNLKTNTEYQMDSLRLANSIGICAGDLGFFEANKFIIENYSNNKNLDKILEVYNNIIIKTLKGEIMDVNLPFINKYNYYNTSESDVIDIYKLKGSYYAIIGPIMLGYALNGKNIDSTLFEILEKIGIVYQIKDDILGTLEFNDIREFKQTILYLHIISTRYKEEFLNLYGKKNITERELDRVRELLTLSGSYEYANNYLENLDVEILNGIDSLNIDDVCKDILKGLLIYINIKEK